MLSGLAPRRTASRPGTRAATVTEDAEPPQRLDLTRRYVEEEGARRMIAARLLGRPNARIRVRPTSGTEYNLPE